MDSNTEEVEPTVLEYARFHGLTTDYLKEPILSSDMELLSSDTYATHSNEPMFDQSTSTAEGLTKERLTVPKEAAMLLKWIHDMQQEQPDDTLLINDRHRETFRLKQELPILRTDPEIDLMNFGSINLPSFKDLRIPYATVSPGKDEGVDWPSKYLLYPKQCDEQVRTEKLAVSKDDFLFLQSAIKDMWRPEDSEKIKVECLKNQRNPVTQPLTPPLLPLSPPLTPYVPSSPGNRLELLSQSSDSIANEAKALQDQIMKDDTIIPGDSQGGSDASDLMLFNSEDFANFDPLAALDKRSPILKRKAEDLKIEGPLTPPMFSQSPMKKLKSVTFKEMVNEHLPTRPSSHENGEDILSPDDKLADFFKEVKPFVEEAKKKMENEKLSEVDATRRVDVPIMDFTVPVAPWLEYTPKKGEKSLSAASDLDLQKVFLAKIKREELKPASSWPGLSKLERELHWSPFQSHLATVTINEKLKDDGDVINKLSSYLTSEDNIATSATSTWKQEGLRILDEYEEDEQVLEAGDFEPRNDMEALVRKKKLEIEEEETDAAIADGVGRGAQPAQYVQRARMKAQDAPRTDGKLPPRQQNPFYQSSQQLPSLEECPTSDDPLKYPPVKLTRPSNQNDSGLMFGGSSSVADALHKFMQIHGYSGDVQEANSRRWNQQQDGQSHQSNLPTCSAASITPARAAPQSLPKIPGPSPPLPQLPSIPTHLSPMDVMISSSLLQRQHRSLTREVEMLYAKAHFVERDFDMPGSPAKEADFLLSPSTGLILTTLQQVKQRALPGQPDQSLLEERIAKLQQRYERLVVLISQGLNRQMEEGGSCGPADTRDTEALMNLNAFARRMDAEVLTQYVQGGTQALARAIVQEMAKWGLPHGSKDIDDLRLLPEETTWESFLRRAGFNPFAAQIILTSLKTPNEVSMLSSSPSPDRVMQIWGLPAFILMTAEERVQRFQVLLGGSRLLKRVNALLDEEWPSAVHGFSSLSQ